MVDNSITPQSEEDIRREREAVALLLAQAAQAMEDAAPTPAPEPVEDIDFNGLLEKQKALAKQREILKNQEAELIARLQFLREEAAALERQSEAVKVKAQKLFETLFGRAEHPAPPQPLQIAKPEVSAPSRKLDNSVVFDKSVGTGTPGGALAPAEVTAVAGIPLQF